MPPVCTKNISSIEPQLRNPWMNPTQVQRCMKENLALGGRLDVDHGFR